MVGYLDTFDNQSGYDEKFAGKDIGPYIGVVKFTNDPTRQGRLGVNIPELTQTANPSPEDCIWCNYLSPFYGSKSVEATSKSDPNDYKSTQHSYGFWAVPPDIDTEVLVIFAKGEASRKNAFWIGCVQGALTNQQVPGYGSSTETIRTNENAREAYGIQRKTNYGTDFLPVGEKNRRMIEAAQTATFAQNMKYPVNDILADQLLSEGLIQDNVRGTTSSSARRETPSQVFGLSTPGRIREDSRTLNIGVDGQPVLPDREPGHSFVMDDGDIDGDNQQTRIRTASGHQILMNDTDGVVYIANGSGNAWIEMDKSGRISLYSNKEINVRSEGDFNLHADKNINFHAKEKIKFTAEKDLTLNSQRYLYAMGESGILNSSQKGSVRHYGRDGITSFTDGTQLHGAKGRIDLAGKQVHFNSVPPRSTWGPKWLKPEHQKIGIRTLQKQDIVAEEPIKFGKANTVKIKTTIDGFITHEPYKRPAGGRDKDDIA